MHNAQRQLTTALIIVGCAAIGTFAGVNYALFATPAHHNSYYLVEQIVNQNPEYIPFLYGAPDR